MNLLADILIWPKVGFLDILLGLIGIVILVSIFSLGFSLWMFQQNNKRLWYVLYEKAMKKGLSPKEIRILEYFFWDMKKSFRQFDIPEEQKKIKKLLLHKLLKRKDLVSVPEVIQILEKLFSKNTTDSNFILSLKDLHPSEYCGVLIDNQYHLGIFLEHSDNVFSIQLAQPIPVGKTIEVHFYRTNTGNHSLKGKVLECKENRLSLEYCKDSLLYIGGEHLMSIVHTGITINSVTGSIQGNREFPENDSYSMGGTTEKISNRAFQLHLPDHPYISKLLESDSLEATLLFADGKSIHCIGRLIRSEFSGYIFRISYIHPNEKSKLMTEILSNKPTREQML